MLKLEDKKHSDCESGQSFHSATVDHDQTSPAIRSGRREGKRNHTNSIVIQCTPQQQARSGGPRVENCGNVISGPFVPGISDYEQTNYVSIPASSIVVKSGVDVAAQKEEPPNKDEARQALQTVIEYFRVPANSWLEERDVMNLHRMQSKLL